MKIYIKTILQMIFIGALAISLIPQQFQRASAQQPSENDLPVSFLVTHSDDDGIDIWLSAPSYQTSKIDINGETFDQIIAPNTANKSTPGQFQLPLASTLIGVPPQAEISLEIIQDIPQELPGEYRISLAPFPAQSDELNTEQQWDYSLKDSNENPNYQVTSFSARIADEAWIRDQRVIRLEYSPFEFHAGTGKLVWHPQVSVKLHFDYPFGADKPNSETAKSQSRNASFDALLEASLLNFEQAKTWQGMDSLNSINAANTTQGSLPGLGSRYRIGITEDGIYTLDYNTLMAIDPIIGSIDPRLLKMTSQGKDVAIQIVGEGDGSFDPGDYIVFYGERFYGDYLASLHQDENQNWHSYLKNIDNYYFFWKPEFNAIMLEKYTLENVYWLSVGTSNGLRMTTVNGEPSGNSNAPVSYYRETVHAEDNSLWNSILFAGEETWFSTNKVVSPNLTREFTTTVSSRVDSGPNAVIRAEFVAKGQDSDPGDDHHTEIYLNDPSTSDEFFWSGQIRYTFDHEIPADTVVNGENSFVIKAFTDAQVAPHYYFDWFEIEYNREFVAVDNAIKFTSPETGLQKYQVTGFSTTTNMRVLDITDPFVPVRVLNPQVTASDATISLTHEDLTVAMAAGGKAVSQSQVSYYEPPNWSTMTAGADYVFITHADFLAAAQNMAAYRESTGLSTEVIDVQDLYNEFFYGIYNPIAIKYFLAYTFDNWQIPPTYALLIGDGHFNFHDYNLDKYGATEQYMPPNLAWVDPWQGEVDSSNLLATIVGDDVYPDLFIARLPVNTNAEANAYLSKLTAYEGTPYSGSWEQNHAFITENPDSAGNFDQLAEDIIETYIDPYGYVSPVRLYQTAYGCYSYGAAACDALTQDIKNAINGAGALLVSYIGHAGVNYWSNEQIFTLDDIPDLSNSGQTPVILSMTCLDGYWNFPSNKIGSSLTELLVRSDDTGAIATFSPTGLGVSTGHDVLHKGFYDSLMVDGNWEMATAAHQGKLWLYQSGSHFDLIKTYTIYGDPALRIQEPFTFSGSPAENEIITHSPGNTETHTITVQNTGSFTDTYLVEAAYNWVTNVTDLTTEVPAGGSIDIPVEVTTPLAYGVSDTAVITITSRGDQSEVFTSSLTTTIPFDYGYEVTPLASSELAQPSTSVEHSFTLTNTGNKNNAYSISISGNTWPTNASISSTGDMGNGEVVQFTVTVDSPNSENASDNATLSITSQNGLPLLTEIPITTTIPLGYDFSVTPSSDARAVPPGTPVTYTLEIQNTGLQSDEYQITFSGNNWETNISTNSTGELAFLETAEVKVTVSTPNQGNLSDTVTVFISSPTKQKEVVLTTSTLLSEIYLPLVIR